MEGILTLHDPAYDHLRKRAARQLTYLMHRRSLPRPRAHVELAQVQCPSGVNKRCRIDLQAERNRTITIIAVARDWAAALEGAVRRARRTLIGNRSAPPLAAVQPPAARLVPAVCRPQRPLQRKRR